MNLHLSKCVILGIKVKSVGEKVVEFDVSIGVEISVPVKIRMITKNRLFEGI